MTGTVAPYPLLLHAQGNMLICTNEPDSVVRGCHFLRHKSAPLMITPARHILHENFWKFQAYEIFNISKSYK